MQDTVCKPPVVCCHLRMSNQQRYGSRLQLQVCEPSPHEVCIVPPGPCSNTCEKVTLVALIKGPVCCSGCLSNLLPALLAAMKPLCCCVYKGSTARGEPTCSTAATTFRHPPPCVCVCGEGGPGTSTTLVYDPVLPLVYEPSRSAHTLTSKTAIASTFLG